MRKPRFNLSAWKAALSDIYNLHDQDAKGRLISLGSGLMAAFYNVFITGIFYTGFLSMYDIDITGVGIVTFVPTLASCFSVFSSMILERIKKRKWVLVAAKIYFYAMYILATTLMPQFVTDPHDRLIWFIVILFLAYSVYSLFSPGFTSWFYAFYPADNERRTRYINFNQIFSSIMSSLVLLGSALLTDAVAGSPYQKTLILGLRYFAFVLVLVDVFMQSCAIEYPYPQGPKIRFTQVFTLPFKYKKFLGCLLLSFAWNYIANLNSGLWGYHLLNHMHFSYTLINAMSVMYTVILIFTSHIWRRVLRRFSWIKTFGLTNLIWVPTEIIYFFMTPRTAWLYIPMSVWQNILNVGFNLSYANVLYMNLPAENSSTHIAFYSIGCNLFAFLGLMTGTLVASITGDTPMLLWGMEIYSVQYTTLMRAVTMFLLGLFLVRKWRLLTRDQDIAEIEELERVHRQQRPLRRAALRRRLLHRA